MSSLALPSQSFQPAAPLAIRATARALVAPVTWLSASLRSAIEPVAGRVRQWRRASESSALRELAQAHLATDPSYAADLMAAANAYDNVVEPA